MGGLVCVVIDIALHGFEFFKGSKEGKMGKKVIFQPWGK